MVSSVKDKHFITSSDDFPTSTIPSFRHGVFSFVVVDIMSSSYMRRFWFGFVQKDLDYSGEPIISSLYFTYLLCELIHKGWNEVRYREISCILTKGRMKNRIYLLQNLRLINMKIMAVF